MLLLTPNVVWVIDLGARFKGSSTVVEVASGAIPRFYRIVVESLKPWVPKKKAPTKERGEALPEEKASWSGFFRIRLRETGQLFTITSDAECTSNAQRPVSEPP